MSRFVSRDWDAVALRFTLPFIVYTRSGAQLISDRAILEEWFEGRVSALSRLDIDRADATLLKNLTVSDGMLTCLVRHNYWSNGARVGFDTYRYFIRRSEQDFKIEMLERL